MNFRGTVKDEFGKPLWGVHVITLFRGQNVGTTTDENGVFTIADARSDETWKITHVGFEDIIFRIPKQGGSMQFTMKEYFNELEGVVLTPTTNEPVTAPVSNTPPYSPVILPPVITQPILTANPVNQAPVPTVNKNSLLDKIKNNPIAAFGIGFLAFAVLGASTKNVSEPKKALPSVKNK